MIIDEIKKDLIIFQKEKRQIEVSSLRMILSSITNKEKDKRLSLSSKFDGKELEEKSKLDEKETLEVIFAEAKKRKDAIYEYEKAGRQDLVEKEKQELETFKKYLPLEMSDEEIKKIVIEILKEKNITSMKEVGIVMKEAIIRTKGLADNKKVNTFIKELLN